MLAAYLLAMFIFLVSFLLYFSVIRKHFRAIYYQVR